MMVLGLVIVTVGGPQISPLLPLEPDPAPGAPVSIGEPACPAPPDAPRSFEPPGAGSAPPAVVMGAALGGRGIILTVDWMVTGPAMPVPVPEAVAAPWVLLAVGKGAVGAV